MTTKELLKIVQDRGMSIIIQDGRPVLKRPTNINGVVTDNLLAVLKVHRERIIKYLSPRDKTEDNHGDAWEG